MRIARKGQRGQVALEAALMMPFTVFMILGIIQLSLMQQARLLTQYAAFRAARAGSLGQAVCQTMTDAAVEGILPSYGRTDSATAINTTWTTNAKKRGYPKENKTNVSSTASTSLQKMVQISYIVEDINGAPGSPYDSHNFDDPGKGMRLSLQVIYNYEMRIPFANWMIHEMWTGGNYFKDSIDLLSPSKNTAPNVTAASTPGVSQTQLIKNTTDLSGSGGGLNGTGSAGGWRFFLPIPASSSMRMMSDPEASVTIGSSASECP